MHEAKGGLHVSVLPVRVQVPESDPSALNQTRASTSMVTEVPQTVPVGWVAVGAIAVDGL